MSAQIQAIEAQEILDSRGTPTLRVHVYLDHGVSASASVPSGASTGSHEAVELRDEDKSRYAGKGVLWAVDNVNRHLAPLLKGLNPCAQAEIDHRMIECDGTPEKAVLGANAMLGVSMAVARAAALSANLPLYAYLGGIGATHLPIPMMNVLNGGKHADSGLDFQEFMIYPLGAPNFAEALRYGAETFRALKTLLAQHGCTTSVGDVGGFAPIVTCNEEACDLIVMAIERAGYVPGRDIAIALDIAANSFYRDGHYCLQRGGQGQKTSVGMVSLLSQWLDRYPIVSIEDGHHEGDVQGFRQLTAELGDRVQIVGDDLLVTHPQYIQQAIQDRSCNAALIKPNQIGTISETLEAIQLCRRAGWGYVVSHRSGETEDSFIADLAVAMGGGQIKTGSPCRSERMAKYNRLLEIERHLGARAVYGR
ncbi:phosphopyruvate hydratase [Paludibacterium sp. B53371]|uniref:phosphopyruvate hydratase n=1 Tax=Paludibacterium sp. B53371 TaxID=2806263 RepID=UPI001C0557C0|nr:phosphopyruvate hydratase [Paludibacterium sp. B53371]